MTIDDDALLRAGAAGRQGEAAQFIVAADHFLAHGQLELAASALDRAFGLAPEDPSIVVQRRDVLDQLAITEHGLLFRYVPAGTFLMGSSDGDPDERPVHAVSLAGFWITERPVTWAEFCDLLGWVPPPIGQPREHGELPDDRRIRMDAFHLREANKIRRGYCSGTVDDQPPRRLSLHADDDDDHDEPSWLDQQPEDEPPPARPREYDCKPMVALGWTDAEQLAERLSSASVRYALPSEAQWEKAARGGLIGRKYSWGDESPSPERCDFGHFGQFSLANPRSFPANGYGLFGMCGGVWEWTSTLYDALAYANRAAGRVDEALDGRPDERLIILNDYQRAATVDPKLQEQPHLRVLRGGSWADGAPAVTVSIRMAREGWGWKSGQWSGSDTPNLGFRLVRW
jgi:formylglycine-generating enzyme